MEPSRVTLEEAQELFQICMPGIKKEEKPAALTEHLVRIRSSHHRFFYQRNQSGGPLPRIETQKNPGMRHNRIFTRRNAAIPGRCYIDSNALYSKYFQAGQI